MMYVTTPWAVLLLVWMGVGGCLWPISSRRFCIGIDLWVLMLRAPDSGLGCTRHDGFENFRDIEYGTIIGWVFDVG